jgi:Family of unknown function (DUF6519)
MYGDLSRLIFDPTQHYSRVVVQQGRVTLDADANEEASILLHYLRALAADLIGPYGTPSVDGTVPGFQIDNITTGTGATFTIGPGHYYVDGILCEADGTNPIDYFAQPDGYFDPKDPNDPQGLPDTTYLVWLKVWERYISWAEDPDLREVALGLNGPDTTGRTRVVWQVLASKWPSDSNVVSPPDNPQDFYASDCWPVIEPLLLNPPTGTLMAQAVQPPKVETDACILPPSSGYRGPENQLYRVEINRDGLVSAPTTGSAETGTPGPTFKWSRDNGSVILPITGFSGNVASVTTLGRDPQLSVDVGNYVQIWDDAFASQGTPGPIPRYGEPLHLVTAVDPVGLTVTLDEAPSTSVGQDPARHPYLRRWDEEEVLVTKAGLTIDSGDEAIDLVANTWIDLENGIQIQFSDGSYRAGDYWLIPARVVTGDVEWPEDASGNKLPLLPIGVDYHAAPLAIVIVNTDNTNANPIDVRMGIPPAAQFLPLPSTVAAASAAGPATQQARSTTRQPRSTSARAGSTTRQPRSTSARAGSTTRQPGSTAAQATPQPEAPSAGTQAGPTQGQQPTQGEQAAP